MMKLFRTEATDNHRRRLLGDVIIVHPYGSFLFTMAILSIFVIIGFVLLLGKYERSESVPGSLALTAGLVSILSPTIGSIEEVFVEPGSRVERGDPLVRIGGLLTGSRNGEGDHQTGSFEGDFHHHEMSVENIDKIEAGVRSQEKTSSNGIVLQEEESFIIAAARDGVITSLNTNVGGLISQGDSLVDMRDANDPLVAELIIPIRMMEAVSIDQKVSIQYTSVIDTASNFYDGSVIRISDGLYLPEEQIGALLVHEPSHRVTVQLQSQSISVFGRNVELRPGMSLQADISRHRRPLIELFLNY